MAQVAQILPQNQKVPIGENKPIELFKNGAENGPDGPKWAKFDLSI